MRGSLEELKCFAFDVHVVDVEMVVGDAYAWCLFPSVIHIREYRRHGTAYPVKEGGGSVLIHENTKSVSCLVVKLKRLC